MIFREFDPKIHDVYKVAELIYDVDYRTFVHVFKSKEEGVEAIKNRLLLIDFAKDREADENDLFYVFFDDEDVEEKEIIGMFNGGKGVQHSLFGDIKNQINFYRIENQKLENQIILERGKSQFGTFDYNGKNAGIIIPTSIKNNNFGNNQHIHLGGK